MCARVESVFKSCFILPHPAEVVCFKWKTIHEHPCFKFSSEVDTLRKHPSYCGHNGAKVRA